MNKRLALVGKTENDEPIVHQGTPSASDAATVLEVIVGKTIIERLLALDRHSNVLGVAGRVTGDVEDHRGIGILVSRRVEGVGRGHVDVDLFRA